MFDEGLGYNDWDGDRNAPASQASSSYMRRSLSNFKGVLVTVALAALVFLLISTSFQNFQVEGTSMTPNIQDGQFIVVNKAAYRHVDVPGWARWVPFLDRDGDDFVSPFGSPQRGDVIVFSLESQPGRNFIKRVIGLPGERIQISRSRVFINGEEVQEPYIPRQGRKEVAELLIPEDEYFVMGDERVASFDSRDWGTLPRDRIIGKAWVSYYPFDGFGRIKSQGPEAPSEQ